MTDIKDIKRSEISLEVKRIIIFCVIAFLPLWIILPILNGVSGEMIFASENALTAAYVVGIFVMFIPSAANILTRVFTGEGFKNSYLGFKIDGKKRYFIASIAVKPVEAVLCALLIWLSFSGELSFGEAFPGDNVNGKIGLFLFQLAVSVIMFFPAFGEEWGWRGYLMPKLIKIMGKPAAVIIGGVIWGLWYAPLTISGHNFGVEYPFYPWLGILIMCVMCIFSNAFLTLLTERTRSIFPAAFCRMISGNLSAMAILSIFGSEALLVGVSDVSTVTFFLFSLPISAITGVVSFILLMKKD